MLYQENKKPIIDVCVCTNIQINQNTVPYVPLSVLNISINGYQLEVVHAFGQNLLMGIFTL